MEPLSKCMPSVPSISSIVLEGDEVLLADRPHDEVANVHVPVGGDGADLGDFGGGRCSFGVGGGS